MRTLRSSFLSSHPVAPSEDLRGRDDQTHHISGSISPCCRDCPGRAEGGSEGEVMAHNAANRAPQFGHQRPGLDATASRGGGPPWEALLLPDRLSIPSVPSEWPTRAGRGQADIAGALAP
ncbi:hypothetical protein MRX96_019353 [Rhipicephalus microplus]